MEEIELKKIIYLCFITSMLMLAAVNLSQQSSIAVDDEIKPWSHYYK